MAACTDCFVLSLCWKPWVWKAPRESGAVKQVVLRMASLQVFPNLYSWLPQLSRLAWPSCAIPLYFNGAMQVLQQQQRCSRPVTHTTARQQQLVVVGIAPRSPSAAAAVASTTRAAAAAAAGIGPSRSSSSITQLQQHQQLLGSSRRGSSSVVVTAAAATSSLDLEELIGPTALEPEVFEIVTYALKLAWTSETYYVHSWMVLLGLLKKENSIACEVRQQQQSAAARRGRHVLYVSVYMLAQQLHPCTPLCPHHPHPLPTHHTTDRSCVSWVWTTSTAPGTKCCGRSTFRTASTPAPSRPTCSGASAPASSCRRVPSNCCSLSLHQLPHLLLPVTLFPAYQPAGQCVRV